GKLETCPHERGASRNRGRPLMTTTAEQKRTQPKLETLDDYLAWVEARPADGAALQPLVTMLLTEKFETQAALEQVRQHHEVLRAEIEALCAPEQYPVIVTAIHLTGKPSVEVSGNGGRLRV